MFSKIGALLICIVFLSTNTLQNNVKDETQQMESKNRQLTSCGIISEDNIREICNEQNRQPTPTKKIQEDGLMKHIIRRAIMADDCCTPECIERFVKIWYCADQRYKVQANASQGIEATEKPANITKATPFETTTTNMTKATPIETTTTNITKATPIETTTANITKATPIETTTANITKATPIETTTTNIPVHFKTASSTAPPITTKIPKPVLYKTKTDENFFSSWSFLNSRWLV